MRSALHVVEFALLVSALGLQPGDGRRRPLELVQVQNEEPSQQHDGQPAQHQVTAAEVQAADRSAGRPENLEDEAFFHSADARALAMAASSSPEASCAEVNPVTALPNVRVSSRDQMLEMTTPSPFFVNSASAYDRSRAGVVEGVVTHEADVRKLFREGRFERSESPVEFGAAPRKIAARRFECYDAIRGFAGASAQQCIVRIERLRQSSQLRCNDERVVSAKHDKRAA